MSSKIVKQIIIRIVEQNMSTGTSKQSSHIKLHSVIPSQYLSSSSNVLDFNDFVYHPQHISYFISGLVQEANKPSISKARVLKWIAMALYCQPVLVKIGENAVDKIVGQGIFGDLHNGTEDYLIMLLEALNVFCLIKGFSLQILKISEPPSIHPSLQYANSLWKNTLPHLTSAQIYPQTSMVLATASVGQVQQLIQFLQQIAELKQTVAQRIYTNGYSEISTTALSSIALLQNQQYFIHQLDIEIAKYQCLTLAEYLPDSYKAEYIEIWINRTVELNSLLGNFVCKEKFGQFEYVKGPLLYAMEKGIMLVLNNFEHISNQLLVGMRTLSEEMKIFHNQKTYQARGGFKILGLVSDITNLPTKLKSMVSQYMAFIELPKRSVLDSVPNINNDANKVYIIDKLKHIENKFGLLASRRLWKRITRLRKNVLDNNQNEMWEGFFTQSFKDSIELQIQDIMSVTDQTRTIHHEQKHTKMIIGRATIDIVKQPSQRIVKTQYSLSILERLALCSELGETPLLISETGCGKTTLVQYLAELSGHQLYVYNMSSGTDVMDLVGGFKPVDCRSLLRELFYRFVEKFRELSGAEKNEQYLQQLLRLYNEDQLKRLLPSLSASITKIKSKLQTQKAESSQLKQWDQLKRKFDNIHANLSKIDSNLVFSFLEGNLVKALKNGDWVLIDEINMATNDVLQKIVPLIEGKSLLLYEKGDLTYIERNPDFRIIACMNPANDSGKKPLPANLAEKFTLINLPEPLRMDIEMMVKQMAPQLNSSEIADIYFSIKKQKTISLRNLSRCLSYLNRNKDIYTFKRALYDALLLGFQEKAVLKKFEDSTPPKMIKGFTEMHGFLVETGSHKHEGDPEIFHLTDTFLEHLKDFLRAIAGTQLPVLLQGPTSAGKTSIIRYVASVAGHICIRINNHEHTQIEEYLGNYFPDKQGKLVFREGPLVQAVREGHWLILDQLNLARTQILECLNRLLDDNRELFIPEQQIHIKPHKNFRIFATQNPSSYSGRKTLSRAFRNRFISLNFGDITIEDTMAIMKVRRPILNDSKELAVYVKKVLQNLQNYRQKQRVFSKDGVITIRDLLKWTGRKFTDKTQFVKQGYALLVQRLRSEEQKKFVEGVLFNGLKLQEFDMKQEYEKCVNEHLSLEVISKSNIYVQMNQSFKRMAALTLKAVTNNEPVLLVGQTGCGKTTLAELLASISQRKFYSINCHKHTEASDLLGCLRPCVKPNSLSKFEYVNGVVIDAMLDGAVLLIDEINTAQDSVLQRLNQVLESGNIGVERGEGWETVTAKPGFCIIATMNPSGDYGKKQLSPALRNRFTQIWVEPITHPQYIVGAETDILTMITHKLSYQNNPILMPHRLQISRLLYKFITDYNCTMAPKYGLTRKLLTMRDIGWVCKFICECQSQKLANWQSRYYWALRILAIEGVNFMMDALDSSNLIKFKQQLLQYMEQQVPQLKYQPDSISPELEAISIVKDLTFPLLIKTDLPLELLSLTPDEYIFFSPHTQLSDLLGQFRPHGSQFIWQDETLLKTVKKGKRVALMDLNLAQQPVIEGINSLFDHRGSIFVVELNEMFMKHSQFRPVVVIKQTNEGDRRGLPNSFLNRFIKIRVKDVSKQTKLKYLQAKYKIDSNESQIWKYVSTVLAEHPKTKIQSLEYVCALFMQDSSYLQRSIQLLSLPSNSHHVAQSSLHAEEQIVQLLPLTAKPSTTALWSPRWANTHQVSSLIDSAVTLKHSGFSVCLVGEHHARDSMAKWIAGALGKRIVKVILSTMTDMADLLGSYEQIESDELPQEAINDREQCTTVQQAQHKVYSNIAKRSTQHSSQGDRTQQTGNTSFAYIESQIVKTLRQSAHALLYIEVPNEALLERVEKGLKPVYQQQASVIVGVDHVHGHNHEGGASGMGRNTKFVHLFLNNLENTTELCRAQFSREVMEQRREYFKSNLSNFGHLNSRIRQLQTQEWIEEQSKHETSRGMVKAWQRLFMNVSNNTMADRHDSINESANRSTRMHQISRQICGQVGLLRDYEDRMKQPLWDETAQLRKSILVVPESRAQQQILEQIWLLFSQQQLTSNNEMLKDANPEMDMDAEQPEQKIVVQNGDQHSGKVYNSTIAHKFQYLYVGGGSNGGGFGDQAGKLLALCYNSLSQADDSQIAAYRQALFKLQQQICIMYKASSSQHESQLLVPYSATEYKLIPILTPTRASLFHYSLTNLPSSINKLAGLHANFSTVTRSPIQKCIVQYIGHIMVQLGTVADWVWKVDIRELSVLELVQAEVIQGKLDYFSNLAQHMKNTICSDHKLMDSLDAMVASKKLPSMKAVEDVEQFYRILFNATRPSESMLQNLWPHIRTQSQLSMLLSLSQEDSLYLQVYHKLCVVKYCGYLPNSYASIQARVRDYEKEHQQVKSKWYVYRGYDDIKMLKDYYQHLIRVCAAVETSNFEANTVKQAIVELYRDYYWTFKDITWPILCSLISIHSLHLTRTLSAPSLLVQPMLPTVSSFSRALQLIMQKEQQEEEFHDAAKNYTKLQRKFKNTVIVDEYTQQGVDKNKQNEEDDYKEFFGKQEASAKKQTILDELYMLVRKRVGCKYQLKMLSHMFKSVQEFPEFVLAFELKLSSKSEQPLSKHINIYEEYSFQMLKYLCAPIAPILLHTKQLLSKYSIDSVKAIAALCNKIQEHKAHDEVYKVLIDCEYLIEKIYQLYPILPMSERIKADELESRCMAIRKVELANWKTMLQYKISRVEKSDTIDFMHFYRNFVQIGNIGQSESLQGKQCFKMCDDFMRNSKLSCYEYRLHLLSLVSQYLSPSKCHLKHNINRIVNFYSSLKPVIMEFWEGVKKEKVKQVSEYQKLSKWDSNNFLIFRQSVEHFQKKIHKILKKYEQELGMQVSIFHANHRNKGICQSVQEFGENYKMAEEAKSMFQQDVINQLQQNEKQNVSSYEGVVQKIFEALSQIKQQHHNNQSKLLIIRNGLGDLQQTLQTLPVPTSKSEHFESKILVEEMFPDEHPSYFAKANKYYFGIWDRLSQKTQTAWNRQIVDRVWAAVEKIWVTANSKIPQYRVDIGAEIDDQTDDLLILFQRFLGMEQSALQQKHHPIFTTEINKVKDLLRARQSEYLDKLSQKFPKIDRPQQLLSLLKMGYVLASIALNLEKNGLCVKENEQEGEQSGTQQVGQGVGIGEGQAHEGAQNVGDQIEFEEQVQGHKGEQKNQQQNQGKNDEKDIEMQGDFEGQMYNKQEEAEGEDGEQAEEKEPDEQMGEVDDKQREQDMKNDQGKAEGDKQADVDIDGQQQGQSELVDNEQEQKQARKGQNREQQQDEGQQEKSDWDDNNEQGEKINKQKGGQMEDQQDDNENQNQGSQLSSVDHDKQKQKQSEKDGQQGESQSQQVENSEMKNQNDEDQQEEEGPESGNKEGNVMDEQVDEQAQQQQEEKQKKVKRTRRTNIEAFGRSDLNSNNPLKSNQDQAQNQQKMNSEGAAEVSGGNEGQKGAGDPIHSLSAELLKQIENLQRVSAKQNANFMKDLNVVAHDENNEQIKQGNQNREEQQFELTEQQNKMSTNLPAFLDSDKKQEQPTKKEEATKNQRKQQKEQKKQPTTKKQSNNSKLQKTKNVQEQIQTPKLEQVQQMKAESSEEKQQSGSHVDREKAKKQSTREHKILQVTEEQYLKSIVNAHKKTQQTKKQMNDQDEEHKLIVLNEAYEISKVLEEQLKSVLEPMDNAEYRGDYKTGKKLNLKKIIPFIASNFRKDKIWLRRTEPSERNYYIMLALDDTKSMKHGEVGNQALKGLLAISLALQHLSIKTCITGIRDSMNIHKPFQGLLEADKIVRSFDFTHESHVSHDLSIASFMQASLQQFKKSESFEAGVQSKQLCFIISDGKMNKDYVRPYLREAKKRDIIYVFIIVDSDKASILNTKSAMIDASGKVKMKLYMSDFPFEYFLIVRNVRQLGDVLASTLLQFIQEK